MKKYSIVLALVHLVASALILLSEAKALNFDSSKEENGQAEVRDMETETVGESDIFPDIISFASNLYQ